MLKYYYNTGPNPTKVTLFLEEAGLEYDPIPLETRKGAQFTPEYLAINPNTKAPSIVDGEVTVFDSNAIYSILRRKQAGTFRKRQRPTVASFYPG